MEDDTPERPSDESAAAFAARKLEELLRGTRKLDDLPRKAPQKRAADLRAGRW